MKRIKLVFVLLYIITLEKIRTVLDIRCNIIYMQEAH